MVKNPELDWKVTDEVPILVRIREPKIQMIVFPFGVPREVAGKAESGDENLNQVINALGSLEPCANFDSTL